MNGIYKNSPALVILSLNIFLCAIAFAAPAEYALKKTSVVNTSAENLVKSIYASPEPDFMAFYDPERRPNYYSPSVVAEIAKAENCYKKKFSMPHLEFDYITIGGDYDITNLEIATQSEKNDHSTVRVSFGMGDYYTELYYSMLETPDGWRIDNVTTHTGHSLADSLRVACAP